MKTTISRHFVSIFITFVMAISFCCSFSNGLTVRAYSYSGSVYNNGLGGITIDITAYPYNTLKNGSEYGSGGCAWFASSRVKELTGYGDVIWGSDSWWKYGANYGFYTDQTPSAGSIMCWTDGGWGHVAILEKIVGDTAYISEGGNREYPNNSYCRIYSVSVSEMTKKDNLTFRGYVHFNAEAPVDLGDSFCAYIINTQSWKHLTNESDDNVDLRTETGYAEQVWKFTKKVMVLIKS